MKYFSELNNRELSIVIWFVLFLIWIFTQKKVRKASISLIKAFLAKKLLYGYIAMFLYITAILTLFYSMGVWGFDWIKNTLLWIICVAFVMLMNFSKSTDKHYLKNSLKDNLKILIVLEFVINLYVFNLWVELAIVPFSTLLGGMIAITDSDEQYRVVKKLLDIVLSSMGLVFFVYAIYMISNNFDNFMSISNLRDFLLPIFLTILFLPFVYFVALYSNYESLFTRMPFFIKDDKLLSYSKRKTLFSFTLNLYALDRWSRHFNSLIIKNRQDIDIEIKKFKKIKPEKTGV